MVQTNRENETQAIAVKHAGRNVQLHAMYEWALFTGEHSTIVILRQIDCTVFNHGTVLDVKDLT